MASYTVQVHVFTHACKSTAFSADGSSTTQAKCLMITPCCATVQVIPLKKSWVFITAEDTCILKAASSGNPKFNLHWAMIQFVLNLLLFTTSLGGHFLRNLTSSGS